MMSEKMSKLLETIRNRVGEEKFEKFLTEYSRLKKLNEVNTK
ncbi:MAG: hypothetical protein ABF969_12040 [Sporolactobacillus sp.]